MLPLLPVEDPMKVGCIPEALEGAAKMKSCTSVAEIEAGQSKWTAQKQMINQFLAAVKKSLTFLTNSRKRKQNEERREAGREQKASEHGAASFSRSLLSIEVLARPPIPLLWGYLLGSCWKSWGERRRFSEEAIAFHLYLLVQLRFDATQKLDCSFPA